MREMLCSLPSPIKSQAGTSSASYGSASDAESRAAIDTATNVQAALMRRDAESPKEKLRNHGSPQRNLQPRSLHPTPNRASGLSREQNLNDNFAPSSELSGDKGAPGGTLFGGFVGKESSSSGALGAGVGADLTFSATGSQDANLGFDGGNRVNSSAKGGKIIFSIKISVVYWSF